VKSKGNYAEGSNWGKDELYRGSSSMGGAHTDTGDVGN